MQTAAIVQDPRQQLLLSAFLFYLFEPVLHKRCRDHASVQNENAVSAYFSNDHLLPLGFELLLQTTMYLVRVFSVGSYVSKCGSVGIAC